MTSPTTDTRNPYRRDLEVLTAIWKDPKQEGEEVFLTQRLAQSLVCLLLIVSPATLVRLLGSKCADRTGRKVAIEGYVILKVAILAYLLFAHAPGVFPRIIATVCIADLCVNLSGFVLLRNYWKKSASAVTDHFKTSQS